MNTALTLLWFGLAIITALYVLVMLYVVVLGLLTPFFGKYWEVDPIDPESTRGKKGILREIKPLEWMIVGRGKKPAYVVGQPTGYRLTVKGAKDDEFTMEDLTDWELEQLSKDDPVPELIVSSWGYLSPLYVFRKLVYLTTSRHVVRVWFPFVFHAFDWCFEWYKPFTTDFARVKAKNELDAIRRPNLRIIGELSDYRNSPVVMARDKSDHVLYESSIPLLTATLPTADGFSFRAHITLVVRLSNLLKLMSWEDWSDQLLSAVSNAVAEYFRAGKLESVYATVEEGDTRLQDLIRAKLSGEDLGGETLLGRIGLMLTNVNLNDLIPGDDATEKEVTRIMSIVAEGERRAKVSGMTLRAQVEQLKDADPAAVQNLAAITAAQQGAGKTDFLISTGGAPSVDQGLLNKVAKHTEPKPLGGKK